MHRRLLIVNFLCARRVDKLLNCASDSLREAGERFKPLLIDDNSISPTCCTNRESAARV